MYCFGPRPYPEGFNPVPSDYDTDSYQDQTDKINEVYKNLKKLPSRYQARPVVRAVVVAAFIVGICVAMMALNGSFTTFPQNFTSLIHSFNWTYVGIGAGGFIALSIGAGFVIRRVKSLENPLTESNIGKLSGDTHWQGAYFKRGNESLYYTGYIDISTLDENGNGDALFYAERNIIEHYQVSILVAATTPVHAAAAIAYHIVRLVVIPFYILGCMGYECLTGDKIYENQRFFRRDDISNQMWLSATQIVKAPFYATAQFYAALYSFFDPLNGRKLGSLIEKDWNNGVDRSDGFWSVQGPQSPDWRPEGGGGPDRLGKNGFYAAGCWTPMARVHFRDGVPAIPQEGVSSNGESMTKALHPEKGAFYDITTIATLKAVHNTAVAALHG